MATKEHHVDKAGRNETFAKSQPLDDQTSLEWAFTSLFYSGLHYVEAYFTAQRVPVNLHNNHSARDRAIASDPKLKIVYREYMDLKNFSNTARYHCRVMKSEVFTDEAMPAHDSVKSTVLAHI